jgi:hypothetical protein
LAVRAGEEVGMARVDVIKPYIEKLLLEFFSTDTLTPDQDGDWAAKSKS